MKIAVVNPPFMNGRFSRTSRSPAINKSGTLYWPFWLAHGTGALERAGHEVLFLDCPARGIGESDLLRIITEHRPGMTVVDTSTPSIYSDLNIATMAATAVPGNFTVLVGTHASALPEQCLRLAPVVSAVAVGEYDATLVELAGLATDEAIDGFNTLDPEIVHISPWLLVVSLASACAAMAIVWRSTEDSEADT